MAVAKQAAHLSVLQRAKAALRPLGQAAERIEDAGKAVARRTEAYPRRTPLQMAFQQSCFVAGTPLLTPEGPRAIETLREGDLVLSRDEHDSAGPIEPRRVLRTFVRTAMVLTLRVGGQTIRTTAEHPFWAANRAAWIPAGLLEVGDLLEGADGKRLPVEGIVDEGESATVYNVEVEQCHTYFVGCEGWGFSLWAHNAECAVLPHPNGGYALAQKQADGSFIWVTEYGTNKVRNFTTGAKAVEAFTSSGGVRVPLAEEANATAVLAGSNPLPARLSPGATPSGKVLGRVSGSSSTDAEIQQTLDQIFGRPTGQPAQQINPHTFHNAHGKLPAASEGAYTQFDVPAPGGGGRGVRRLYYNKDTGQWFYSGNSHDVAAGLPKVPANEGSGAKFVEITDIMNEYGRVVP